MVERSVARRRSLHLEALDMDPFASPFSSVPEPAGPMPARVSHTPGAADGACERGEALSHTRENTEALWLGGPLTPGFRLPAAVTALERAALRKALAQARFRQAEAASLLGLTYHQFRALYRKYRDEL